MKDRNGNPMPGYGWIFPVGDGTVNIGVGLLSTFRDFKSVNTTHLLDAYAHQVAERWEIDPGHAGVQGRRSGRIPMGGSVGPKAGPTYLVVGDAAGSVNPFNGEGIDYAYETARMAADGAPRGAGRPATRPRLQHYPRLLDEEYGEYFKVARLFARVIGRPALMRELTRAGDAQPHADGVGAADHGQPAAPRRDRPGRSRVQGGREARQARPQRLSVVGTPSIRGVREPCEPSSAVTCEIGAVTAGRGGRLGHVASRACGAWRGARRWPGDVAAALAWRAARRPSAHSRATSIADGDAAVGADDLERLLPLDVARAACRAASSSSTAATPPACSVRSTGSV